MRFFHNASVGKVLIWLYALVIHGVFGLGAYFMYSVLATLIIGQDGGATAAAIVCGAAVFIGAMWAFMYGEYAREDIYAYQRAKYGHKKGGHIHQLLNVLLVFIAINELSSLGFRISQMASTAQRVWLGGAGVAALAIAILLGQVIHAMANRPLELKVARAQAQAKELVAEDLLKGVKTMTTGQRLRFINGDAEVLDEMHAASYRAITDHDEHRRERQEEEAEKARRVAQEREEEENLLTRFTGKLFAPRNRDFQEAQTNSQVDRLGQSNGRQ